MISADHVRELFSNSHGKTMTPNDHKRSIFPVVSVKKWHMMIV